MSIIIERGERKKYAKKVEMYVPHNGISLDSLEDIIAIINKKAYANNSKEESEKKASYMVMALKHSFERSTNKRLYLNQFTLRIDHEMKLPISYLTEAGVRLIVDSKNLSEFYQTFNIGPTEIEKIRINPRLFLPLQNELYNLLRS